MGDAATPTLPDFTSQTASAYKANIDAGFAVADRIAWAFAPHEQATPDMSVRVDAGAVFYAVTRNLIEKAAQDTGTITAPTTDPRIDRIVIERDTGNISVITGTEAASPTPPDIGGDKSPICQIALVVSQSSIVNADITDERHLSLLGLSNFGRFNIGDGIEGTGSAARVKLDGPSIKRTSAGIAVDMVAATKTGNYTAVAGDRGRHLFFSISAPATLTLTAAATLGNGWYVIVKSRGNNTDDITVDPDGSELIDEGTTLTIKSGQGVIILCTGSTFWTVGRGSSAALTESFESAEQTITKGSSVTVAHGLSSLPKLHKAFLRCKTAEANYTVGDEFECSIHSFSNNYTTPAVTTADATNIVASTGSNARVVDKNTGASFAYTVANWRIIIRAWN